MTVLISLLLSCVCYAGQSEDHALNAKMSLKGDTFLYENEFSVEISVQGNGIRGASANLSYDTKNLTAVYFTPNSASDIKVYYSVSDKGVSFAFYNEAAFSGTLKIGDVKFSIKEGKTNDEITVSITDAVVSDGKQDNEAVCSDFRSLLMADINGDDTSDQTSETTEDVTTDTDEPPVTSGEESTSDIADTSGEDTSDIFTESGDTTDEITSDDESHGTSAETDDVTPDVQTEPTDGPDTGSNNKNKPKGNLRVILAVICVAVSGAAVGAAVLIRYKVKPKK